jgi:hypothetical protein
MSKTPVVWKEAPSWVKRSRKFALFAVIILFIMIILFSFFRLFTSNFSCHSGGLVGFSAGSSSLGNCFKFPMLIFVFAVAPAAIVGAILGIIIDMILFFVNRLKKN